MNWKVIKEGPYQPYLLAVFGGHEMAWTCVDTLLVGISKRHLG